MKFRGCGFAFDLGRGQLGIKGKDLRQRILKLANHPIKEALIGALQRDEGDIGIRKRDRPPVQIGHSGQGKLCRIGPFRGGHAHTDGAARRPVKPGTFRGKQDALLRLFILGGTGIKAPAICVQHIAQREGGDHWARGGDVEGHAQGRGRAALEILFQIVFLARAVGDRGDVNLPRIERDFRPWQSVQRHQRKAKRVFPPLWRGIIRRLQKVRDGQVIRDAFQPLNNLFAIR